MRPKAGARYFAANEDRLRLSAEEARIKAEVNALHEALDQRRQDRARLAELEQPKQQAAHRDTIIAAETAFEAAKSHSEALKRADAEAARALHRHGTEVAALANYQSALQQAEQLAHKLAQTPATA